MVAIIHLIRIPPNVIKAHVTWTWAGLTGKAMIPQNVANMMGIWAAQDGGGRLCG